MWEATYYSEYINSIGAAYADGTYVAYYTNGSAMSSTLYYFACSPSTGNVNKYSINDQVGSTAAYDPTTQAWYTRVYSSSGGVNLWSYVYYDPQVTVVALIFVSNVFMDVTFASLDLGYCKYWYICYFML